MTTSFGDAPPVSGSAPSTYNVNLVQPGTGIVLGTLTVNAVADNGSGVVQLSGVAASSSFSIRFCPFPTGTANCGQVTTVTTDAAGNGETTFTFSQHGTFTGIFAGGRGNMDEFESGFSIPSSSLQFQAALEPAASITGGLQPAAILGNDPLKQGDVTIPGGNTVHVDLKGAVGNATYGLTFCMNSDGCFFNGTFNTDGSGNANVDLDFTKGFGAGTGISGVFLVVRNVPGAASSVEFASAFHVP